MNNEQPQGIPLDTELYIEELELTVFQLQKEVLMKNAYVRQLEDKLNKEDNSEG